jgi:hypothetical protein
MGRVPGDGAEAVRVIRGATPQVPSLDDLRDRLLAIRLPSAGVER